MRVNLIITSKYLRLRQERKALIAAIFSVLLLLLTSCGYTLTHRLKKPFLSPQGIFVPVFDNLTDEVGAERIFTDALIRELESRGNVVVSTRKAGAMELKGVVQSISYTPTAWTIPGFKGLQNFQRLPTEIGIYATVGFALIDSKTKRVLWSNQFSDFRRVQAPTNRTYQFEAPSSIPLLSQSLIEAHYWDLAHDIMRDVYDDIVDLFGT